MFKLSTVAFAAFGAVFLLAGQVSALADNPGTSSTVIAFDNATDASLFAVDACNGDNQYGVGHSCAWSGGNEGSKSPTKGFKDANIFTMSYSLPDQLVRCPRLR